MSRKKNFPESHIINPLLAKLVRSEMAWYRPRSLFTSLWTSTPSWSINTQKRTCQYIYVICRPGGPYWEKLCPRSWVLPVAAGRGPCSRRRTQFFPIRTDLGRQITCLLSSLENYFKRNICVDFLLKQFHTVRARLTFRSSKPVLLTEVFKRRDSVFADFRTEQPRIYISWRFLV